MRIAVLASGRGSNLAALLRAREAGTLPVEFTGVYSDRRDAPALAIARDAGLEARAIPPRGFPDREAHDHALFDAVAAGAPDLVVCAGYMRFICASAVVRYADRMVNLHPSLLPKYPGLATHRAALAAGDAEHGASVHAVTAELDGGPVIAQVRIPVRPGDDELALAERLRPREHALLVATVAALARGEIVLRDGAVLLGSAPRRQPLRLGDDDALHADG